MVEFVLVTERRVGVFSEVVERYRNDGWEIVGEMQQLNSGLYCIPMERKVVAKKKAATPRKSKTIEINDEVGITDEVKVS